MIKAALISVRLNTLPGCRAPRLNPARPALLYRAAWCGRTGGGEGGAPSGGSSVSGITGCCQLPSVIRVVTAPTTPAVPQRCRVAAGSESALFSALSCVLSRRCPMSISCLRGLCACVRAIGASEDPLGPLVVSSGGRLSVCLSACLSVCLSVFSLRLAWWGW